MFCVKHADFRKFMKTIVYVMIKMCCIIIILRNQDIFQGTCHNDT